MRKFFAYQYCLFLVSVSAALGAGLFLSPDGFCMNAFSYQEDPAEELRMVVGDVQYIFTNELTRISIVNHAIADTLEVSDSEIALLAKRPGRTEIFLWDKNGRRVVRVWVFQEMLDIVETRMQELLRVIEIDHLKIEKSEMEGKIIVSGELEADKLREYERIIQPFEGSLLNLVRLKEEKDLIEIDVQIAEININFSETLGVDWQPTAFDFAESMPALERTSDFFRIGHFTRQQPITATINALVSQGHGRILSRPKLVVRSGDSASFQVGGEIPIRTTTSTATTTTETISFRSYGVFLTINPLVREGNKIDIDLNVNVTDVDESVRIRDDVGYINRSVQTKLFLEDNQPIVLAGFIKENKGETISQVPFLGKIPVLGMLFRSREKPEKTTELFITLTPRILTKEEEEKFSDHQEAAAKRTQAPALRTDVPETSIESIVKKDAQPETIPLLKEPYTSRPDSLLLEETPRPRRQEAITHQQMPVPAMVAAYARGVQEKIAQTVHYPTSAQQALQQGTVMLELFLSRSGVLISASVAESSGHPLLDEAALQTAFKSAPYDHFPEDIRNQSLTIKVPIAYQLEQ